MLGRRWTTIEAATALAVAAGLALLVPEPSLAEPHGAGARVGRRLGLHVRAPHRAQPPPRRRPLPDRHRVRPEPVGGGGAAADCLRRAAIRRDRRARRRAAARPGRRLHGARPHALHRGAGRRHRAHGRDRHGARTCLRHRARGAAAGRDARGADACRRRADRRRGDRGVATGRRAAGIGSARAKR